MKQVKPYKQAIKNPLYIQFKEQRDTIMNEYPITTKCSIDQIRERTKRIADLMFDNDGVFHKWFWEEFNYEIKNDVEKIMLVIKNKREGNPHYDYRI